MTMMKVSNVVPRPNDVFLGRGGSKKESFYRKLICKHAKAYTELQNGEKRDFIVAKIVEPILKTGGIFYNHNPCDSFGVWRIASDEEIIKKIRSALTEQRKKVLALGEDENGGADESDNDEVASIRNQNHASATKFEIEQTVNKRDNLDRSNSTTDSANSRNVSPQPILYLNEKTGHLLNMDSQDNIYHRLLSKHAALFWEIFQNPNPFLRENYKIRFVWDNVISELQKANCSIILCPESESSIGINLNDLKNGDSKLASITSRTIKCILAALSDLEYIASVGFIRQQQEKKISNIVLQRDPVQSVAASDQIRRRMLASNQWSPMMASRDVCSSQTNPISLSNPMSSMGHVNPSVYMKNVVMDPTSFANQRRQAALRLLEQKSKMRKSLEMQEAIQNAQRHEMLMKEHERFLDVCRQSVRNSVAKIERPKRSLPPSKGRDQSGMLPPKSGTKRRKVSKKEEIAF